MRRVLIATVGLGLALMAGVGLLVVAPLAAEDRQATEAGEALSLITATPDEGFALAITLARRAVTTTQTDKAVLRAGRAAYAQDPDALIAASHTVAVYFQTVAAANDYWRD